jgi:hypothetical protein
MGRTLEPRRAVIARLRGGLGNQMFQYALGRCIAVTQRRDLFLDDRALDINTPGTTPRKYALDVFPIAARLVSRSTPDAVRGTSLHSYVVEQRPGFCGDVLKPSPFTFVYLNGFWQSEAYFNAIAPTIRRDFRLSGVRSEDGGWEPAIRGRRSPVCLHVRRQDYLAPHGRYIGFVGAAYYRRAIDAIARRVAEPHFFVFSDDIAWCEKSLTLKHPHSFVRHPSGNPSHAAVDLRLMTLCDHFIIANSSFSWWAAWLSHSRRKIVVAPKRWFGGAPLDSSDLIPSAWIRV